ncbi:MarR family winged helix-turn-helix transcriptional regulator [Caldovatus aquaticus]|uniref:MarR family transcriptional regulator n=1 Tax=Caldovatus aquaticus TaxID=2865671 RepID=A0ABS7EXY3_9PROT|nr:MarR family transcriptional regulator [Caldovatus aquaticus]MBW8267958.1 MarR family transcriptional regulator [Caldovatus aquaticus]
MAGGKAARAPREDNPTGAARGEPPVRLGPLADFIGFHLRLAQEASFRAFAQRVGDPKLKPSRFAMLTLIHENPGITQTALSRASGRDKSTLTAALDDLVQRGLVLREKDAGDRRSYRLHLTAKGRRVLARLTEKAREHDLKLDRIVGPDRKREFLRLLARIATELE